MRFIPYILYLFLLALYLTILRDITYICGAQIDLAVLMAALVALYKSEMTTFWFAVCIAIISGTPLLDLLPWEMIILVIPALIVNQISARINLESLTSRLILVAGYLLIHQAEQGLDVCTGGLAVRIIPGLMLSSMFILYIMIRCHFDKSLAPQLQGITWTDRWRSLNKIWPIVFLAFFMIFAIYFGIATPTEIAGIGCLFAFLIGFAYRRLNWKNVKAAFLSTCRTTCFIAWILVAASVFGYMLSYLQLPQKLSDWLVALSIPPIGVIIGINIILIFLGCIMDPAGILLVTTPIFAPIVISLGFDPIWFGVVFVVNTELAQITPPLGLNLYIMKGIAPPTITLNDILIGAVPFMFIDLIGLALVIIFPKIILWLPSTMM